jgi:arylformamidase
MKRMIVITAAALQQALSGASPAFLEALVVRTSPNDPAKRVRRYADEPAAFFSEDAMRRLSALPLGHLLVDLPSLDRARDAGKLAAHRLYWNVSPGARTAPDGDAALRTVTEFIYVPDGVRDGPYLLNLQIAPFVLDAAPSRPLLFELERVPA